MSNNLVIPCHYEATLDGIFSNFHRADLISPEVPLALEYRIIGAYIRRLNLKPTIISSAINFIKTWL